MENRRPKLPHKRKGVVNLRNYYTLTLQCGVILALLLFIGIVNLEIRPSEQPEFVAQSQEVVEMEEIIQTRQQPEVPPPPRPPVPVEVPNDVIIDDIDIDISADLYLGSMAELPPPPRQSDPAEEEEEDDFYVFVEQMPELKDGMAALQHNVRYPEMARKANIQGRVHVQFIVNEQGEVENPVIVRGIGGGCDEEAVRVVKQAEFVPGHQRGRPVRVQFQLPVTFVLRDAN
ncbi:MAG: energy transducer TonB [Balneolaceae bacterium]|nr:energy transducer TonB [Balneolaceae bacterium]MCH8549033.1 energy transducer TonB [Balneolaceae bacterium]